MGQAVAVELSRRGIQVFVADLNLAAAEETVRAFAGTKGSAEAFLVDVSRSESVSSLFQKLRERVQRLDLMVHTAAILGRTAFIEDLNDEEWRQMMAVNVDGAFFCCREAVRWMKEHQTGRIILFSSVASLTPTPGALHYS
jgi:NAD(P)-dependent dehydrogenase (short-subunit alcohol dehydrogenase family)